MEMLILFRHMYSHRRSSRVKVCPVPISLVEYSILMYSILERLMSRWNF